MRKKSSLIIGLCILFLLCVVPIVSATERPVRGWVTYPDGTGISGVTATVHVQLNPNFPAFFCYCDAPNTTTSSTGEWVENLNNIVFISDCAIPSRNKGDNCGDDWSSDSHIWMNASGITAVPQATNGQTTPVNISYAPLINGITYLTNLTLQLFDPDGPNVTLISPANNTFYNSSTTIILNYNVTDISNVSNCTLSLNNILNQTDISITKKYSSKLYSYRI